MRPIVTIHGISERRDAAGYSLALRREVESIARKHRLPRPTWREVDWSDLSDLPEGGLLDVADLLIDILRYDRERALREAIQERLANAIAAAPGCVVVAHSLGSVAALDLLLDRGDVGALITLGSPLGISSPLLNYTSRIAPASASLAGLEWLDIWSPADPVHTGNLAGLVVVQGAQGLESVGYPCVSKQIELGTHPIHAHTGYWRQPLVASWVLAAATGDP